jgi:beta-lactamase class A
MLHKKSFIFPIIFAFLLWIWFDRLIHGDHFEEEKIHMERAGTGYLINPLLECELSTVWSNQKYIPFENETKNRIENEVVSKNRDIYLSLYFRNLRNGPWFGINEDADFSPASLMKLPVALSYLKWSEYVPGIKTSIFTWVVDTEYIQNITPEASIKAWEPYSMSELMKYSLVYSDNNANETLIRYLPKEILYKVFNDLSLPIIDKLEAGTDDYISVKEYASFFRMLYNASYLSDLDSSFLLDILTQSTIKSGLRWSIPSDITVAHKFWERRIINPDNTTFTSQFHDCGIVYYSNYPYIICIMTKWGDDIPRLEKIVEDTSRIIFEEIKKRY